MCESSRLFLYDFHLMDAGCRISCVYLSSFTSSNDDTKRFFDATIVREYALDQSEDCVRSTSARVCVQIVSAIFSKTYGQTLSFLIKIGSHKFIANGTLTNSSTAAFEQEFCVPTGNVSDDHKIRITPITPVSDPNRTQFLSSLSTTFNDNSSVIVLSTTPRPAKNKWTRPIVLHTKDFLDRNVNGTITRHSMDDARLDIKVTLKAKS